MEERYRESAERARGSIQQGLHDPVSFRAALMAVPTTERDAWLDAVLELGELPDDGAELPRGCVPYLPCSIDSLLRTIEHANVQAADVFVDIGAGPGRAGALVHLLTGASAVGLEIQTPLVRAARELSSRLGLARVSSIQCDATQLTRVITTGSVFFLYCPFSGERLMSLLDELESIARMRPIRVCAVDVPLPPRDWLVAEPGCSGDLAVYRSTF